ncbi:hypothetical protein J5N97_005114 [Dioscorea zingiberensis]|uniref:F-box domain-containing protein n=1 Tax=Dioscorea zingiberensis TaxID=325984 RepID=A0A9D5D7W0_9LILI|nr:hypothetical protein J5N97_005114 [Dioscorea zingiberensis]
MPSSLLKPLSLLLRQPPPPLSGHDHPNTSMNDHFLRLPDECLALIFQPLNTKERNTCSIVCRRWFTVERQTRHTLSLNAVAGLRDSAPAILSRFDSVTKLTLHFNRSCHFDGIGDDGIAVIALHCPILAELELRHCYLVTDAGLRAIPRHCTKLRRVSLHSCTFGAHGINSIIQGCTLLEELSISKFSRFSDAINGSKSLRTVSLRYIHGGRALLPLISQSPALQSLRIINCSGSWDKHLEEASVRANGLIDVLLEAIDVSDRALRALSAQVSLETLWLADTHRCTDEGVTAVVERCKKLKEIGIRKLRKVGEKSLVAIARRCVNLKLLALARVSLTGRSLILVAENCYSLESLLINGGKRIGDAEMVCVISKCSGLRWLFIRGCPISDVLVEAIAQGCPRLEKLEIRKCPGVTLMKVEELRERRRGIAIDYVGIEEKDEEKDGGVQGRNEEENLQRIRASKLRLGFLAIWSCIVFVLRKLFNK